MPDSSALDIRGLRKVFFHDSPEGPLGLLVLDDVSLRVGKGEFVSVLGPSGCGKTTLARIVVGIEDRTGGEIDIGGHPAGPPGPDRCLVFQNYGLLPWRSVLSNVELGLELQGVPKSERRATAGRYLELVGLTGFEHHFPHQISGGMQQRAGLARALSTQPELLIMDEPFGAVDAQMRTLLQDELLRIADLTGATILFVTHSIEEAIYLSDRILVFSARPGRPVGEVPVDLPKPRYEVKARELPEFSGVRRQVNEILTERTDYYHPDQANLQSD
ncbi:MAG TPA: ABC transporter ATP-binding protein [Candidatus Limnocylindrales bacterium]|nr:ABC transporter ATP-binding protein [Candidatus Limnocylindrales bacterium]